MAKPNRNRSAAKKLRSGRTFIFDDSAMDVDADLGKAYRLNAMSVAMDEDDELSLPSPSAGPATKKRRTNSPAKKSVARPSAKVHTRRSPAGDAFTMNNKPSQGQKKSKGPNKGKTVL